MANRGGEFTTSRRAFVGAVLATTVSPFVAHNEAALRNEPQGGASDWPRFGYDRRNTRFNARETKLGKANVETLKLSWQFEAGAPIQHTPAVIGDSLYFGTWAGDFFALDSKTGARKWHLKIGEPNPIDPRFLKSSPEYSNGRLYFGTGRSTIASESAFLYCVDAATGKIIWRTQLDEDPTANEAIITCSATLFNGNVLVGTSGSGYGQVCCLSAASGQVRWKFATVPQVTGGGGGVWTSPAIDEEHDIVYNGTGEAKSFILPGSVPYTESLIAQDIATGTMLWHYQARPAAIYRNWDFSCHPMIFDAVHPDRRGSVRQCVGAGNKAGFYTVDRYSGQLYWKAMLTPPEGPQLNSTAVAYNRVFVVSNATGSRRPPSSVTAALNAYGGEIEWWVHNGAPNSAPIAVANGVVYQGLMDGRIEALDADTGVQLWQHTLPSGHRGGIAIANGSLFVSNGGPFRQKQEERFSMFCFRPESA